MPGYKIHMGGHRQNREKAEELEDLGWDALGFPEPSAGGNTQAAEGYFRKALAHDPDLADAYNGLGTIFYLQKRFAEAAAMYLTALQKARTELGGDRPKDYTWWGNVSTRPYMRARHNLGLVFWRQGKYAEAIREFKELLRRNPHDNQGIRYLIGGLYHLSRDLPKALSYYRKAGPSWLGSHDPATDFNYGLALFQTQNYSRSVLQFRKSFFLNPYLPQVALHGSVSPYRIWHGDSLAEPSYALDYWEDYSSLWGIRPDAVDFLKLVYEDKQVQSELNRFVQLHERLLQEKNIAARGPPVDEAMRLRDPKRLVATNRPIATRVLCRLRNK